MPASAAPTSEAIVQSSPIVAPLAGQTYASVAGKPLPPDFRLDGLRAGAAWESLSFGPAPAALAQWLPGWPRRFDGGWLALTAIGGFRATDPGLAWVSADGFNWHAIAVPGRVFGIDGGLVAFDRSHAWTSVNGSAWQDEGLLGPADGCATCLFTPIGPIRPVAGGVEYSSQGLALDAYLLPGDPAVAKKVPSVTWTGSEFVAWMNTPIPETPGTIDANIWTSPGATTWIGGVPAIGPLGGAPGNRLGQVYGTRKGLLVEVLDAKGKRVQWFVTTQPSGVLVPNVGFDLGLRWHEDLQRLAGPEGGSAANALATMQILSNGDTFLAIIPASGGGSRLFVSRDGDLWTRVGDIPGQISGSMLLLPGGVYAAGRYGTSS